MTARAGALALATAVYTLATAWLTWPVVRDLTDHVFGNPLLLADVYLVAWILAWGAHALSTHPARLFEGNAFHPTPHVLAGSETLLGDQLVFLPAWLATGNPVLGLNLVLLTSFVLSALFMHLLVRRWTGSTLAAYVAGLAFAAGPWRMDVGRVHLLAVQYLPLIVLLLDRTATGARRTDGLLAAAVLALQVLCSYYVGYMAYLVAGGYVVADLLGRGVRGRAVALRRLGLAVLAPAVVIVPLSLPYLLLRTRGALVYEPAPVPAGAHVAVSAFILGVVGHQYVGWGTLALGFLGLAELPRRWRADPVTRVRLLALLLTALAGVALAHGSAGLLWETVVPFAWMRSVVPGFANVRSAIRFGALTAFAAAALAGYGVAAAGRGRTLAFRVGVAAAATVIVLAPAVRSAAIRGWWVTTPPHVPAVYQWLAVRGQGGPLLELPIGPGLGPQRNLFAASAMYHSTYHWLPLINGHTGYPPGPYPLLENQAAQLPSPEALGFLVGCTGLRWILVHHPPRTRHPAWGTLVGVRLAGVFEHASGEKRHDDWLYEVLAPRPGACRTHLFDPGRTALGGPLMVPRMLQGSIVVEQFADLVFTRSESLAMIVLANDSGEPWPGTAVDEQKRIVVTARWESIDGGETSPDQELLLPGDVVPGGRLRFGAWLRHPDKAGRFRLRLLAGAPGGMHLRSTPHEVTAVRWTPGP